jgi:hypothetical protein
MKYRKKAVVVEASQWWKPGDHAAVIHPVPAEVPVPPAQPSASRAPFPRTHLGTIKTLEGWMLVTPGDFVIRGVHGEHYACKPDIFAKTYEPLEPERRVS